MTCSPEPAATAPRRRGEVLHRAILDAALEQLSRVGWKQLTMEGVAACAQTGKAAVYRRWASKQELVLAALENALPPVDAAPDRGCVRDDLLAIVERVRVVMYSPPGCAFRAVMEELDHAHARAFHTLVLDRVLNPGRRVLADVIRRGIERGEVRPDVDLELVADVGPALMLFHTKIRGAALEAHDCERIVDQVLVPMLRPAGSAAADTGPLNRGAAPA